MNALPATVDQYIASFPADVQAVLRAVRATIRQAAPQAEERISYRMPAMFQNGVVVYFGAFKRHLGPSTCWSPTSREGAHDAGGGGLRRRVAAGLRGPGGPAAAAGAAAVPAMIARRSGKILVMGSASALRGMKRASTYSAARGAQLAYVQAVGVELAPHNVQVNAIAQNFVDNPTYFPPEVQANPRFQERLAREVPLGGWWPRAKTRSFAAYLCSASQRPTASSARCSRSAAAGSATGSPRERCWFRAKA
jgi:NAD(P)-dependent dehydrogenase (short-subunit alcohol dehydrogenase family)